MGYTIIYDKKFIKTNGGVIPLVLAGSSNCYTSTYAGREKRERSWCCFSYKGPCPSAETLMEEVFKDIPSNHNEHFVYNGKWVDDNGFVNFFKSGIRNALTLEELLDKYVVFDLKVSLQIKDLDSDKEYKPTTCAFSKMCQTNEELEKAINDVLAIRKSLPEETFPRVDFSLGYGDNRLETRHKKRKKPNSLRSKAGTMIVLSNGCYLVRKSSRHVWYSHWSDEARLFRNVEVAKEYCQNELRRFPVAEVSKIVSKKYVIRTVNDSPKERLYWAGSKFISDKNFALALNTEAQVQKEMSATIFKHALAETGVSDCEAVFEFFEVATVDLREINESAQLTAQV